MCVCWGFWGFWGFGCRVQGFRNLEFLEFWGFGVLLLLRGNGLMSCQLLPLQVWLVYTDVKFFVAC